MRERIYQLHQKFPAFDIASLCQTLNEFGDEPVNEDTKGSGGKARRNTRKHRLH